MPMTIKEFSMLRATALLLAAFLVAAPLSISSAARSQETPRKPLGWELQLGGKNATAVLLVHGLWQDSLSSWKEPSKSSPTGVFENRTPPSRTTITEKHRGKPVLPSGRQWPVPAAKIDANNWLAALRGAGFSVATWDQGRGILRGPMNGARGLTDEVQPGLDALALLAAETARLNPGAPPPIALIGHSRGGVLIRLMLKQLQKEDPHGLRDRIRQVVTLHSPHQGTALAGVCLGKSGGGLEAVRAAAMVLFQDQAVSAVLEGWDGLARSLCELEANGPFLTQLRSGEQPLEGVQYTTYGGTHPTFLMRYRYVCSDSRSLRLPKLIDWNYAFQGVSAQFPPVDRGGPFAAEWGAGDGLVSDRSSQLPANFKAKHHSNPLNHAEVLWNVAVQQEVVALLKRAAVEASVKKPKKD